ncbi:hypothetical protein BDN72DRAFT_961313 [Pluteus cervinus]|uniref:Uncharacterized protein n=1 Tax=Pluteus cervinus TaxID=181527 RepID=A0ACD3AND6_9AGAR|nr:hypothetical protein BDN72DRAFT_961313 [Pluteus cervinus]
MLLIKRTHGIKSSVISLWDLPEEVLEQILAEIEQQRDLVNFACASRFCSQLVIPRHTEYRVVRLGTTTSSHVWAHLARRPDLARNIREVHMEHVLDNFTASYPREPMSLIEDVDREERTNTVQSQEMTTVLGRMSRLKSFSWDQQLQFSTPLEPHNPPFALVVLDVLQQTGSVDHLCLDIRDTFVDDEPVENCALWKMSHLRSLVVLGHWNDWPITPRYNENTLENWLNGLTSLELLRLPAGLLEKHHASLFFPNLKCIKFATSSWDIEINDTVLTFLGRHPSVEELIWDSHMMAPTYIHLPPNFLPNLRRFDGQYSLFLCLISQTESNSLSPRKFESLALGWYPDDKYIDKLCSSSGIDHQTLRFLSLGIHQTIRDVHKLAAAFPMIEELSLPGLKKEVFSFDEFVSGLEQLKHLKVLYRDMIWCGLGITKGGSDLELRDLELQLLVDKRINVLAKRCPALTQISHPKVYGWLIVICRDKGEVSTRIQNVPSTSRFEFQHYGFR